MAPQKNNKGVKYMTNYQDGKVEEGMVIIRYLNYRREERFVLSVGKSIMHSTSKKDHAQFFAKTEAEKIVEWLGWNQDEDIRYQFI